MANPFSPATPRPSLLIIPFLFFLTGLFNAQSTPSSSLPHSSSTRLARPRTTGSGPQHNVDRIHMVVVSDTHIGGPWFTDRSIFALYDFLQPLSLPETTVHTLVLNGDFLDNWNFNFTERVPSFSELLRSEEFHGVNVSAFSDSLRRIRSNGVRIVAVPGNHDIEIRKSDFEDAGIDVEFIESGIWIENNYRMEHGNRYDLFNAPDPAGFIKPFGYIVTRSYAEGGKWEDKIGEHKNIIRARKRRKKAAMNNEESDYYSFLVSSEEQLEPWGPSYESSTGFVYWLCDHILAPIIPLGVDLFQNCSMLYERIIGASLGETIEILWNSLYKKYKFREVSNGCEYMHNTGPIQLYREVQKYRTMIARWLEHHDKKFIEYMMQGTCYDVEHWAAQVREDVIVMSHTHRARLDVFERSTYGGGHVISANTGSWVSSTEWFSFVRLTTVPAGIKDYGNCTEVELVEWTEGGKEIVRAKSKVPFDSSSSSTTDNFNLNARHVRLFDDRMDGIRPTKRVTSPLSSSSAWNCGESKKARPPGWTCDADFYGTNDGCDCSCGIPDPDCKCVLGSSDCDTILESGNACCQNPY